MAMHKMIYRLLFKKYGCEVVLKRCGSWCGVEIAIDYEDCHGEKSSAQASLSPADARRLGRKLLGRSAPKRRGKRRR